MAGVLRRADGCVLLAERPPGKHLAGLWEFPGGKLEPGEAPRDGLVRELREELGVVVHECTPLIELPWHYGALALLLDTWMVSAWSGETQSLEGQALRWALPEQVDPEGLAPADRAILQLLLRA